MSRQLSQEYLDYIASDAWRRRRALKLMLAGGLSGRVQCELCKTVRLVTSVDVHHVTYENFRNEKMADLSILCRTCHDRIEEIEAAMFGGPVEDMSEVLLQTLAFIDRRLVPQPEVSISPFANTARRTSGETTIAEVVEIIRRKRLDQGIEN